MKKISKLLLVLIGLIVISCSDDIQEIDALTPGEGIMLINPTSSFNSVLDGSKLNQVATTFVWTDSDATGDASVTYTVEAALGETDFASPIVVGTTTNLFLDVTIGTLDATAKSLGIQPLTEGIIDIRIKSSTWTSNVVSIKVTPYQPNWGIIGSATPFGWDNSTDMRYNPMTGKYSISLYLLTGEFKFRLDNSWDTNFGDDGNDLTLDSGGANIPVAEGNYTIVLDLESLNYSITPIVDAWGIIGSATPTGWDSDTMMDFDSVSNTYSIVIDLVEGAYKFRLNQDWGTNYGDNGNDLTLDSGGADIPVTASGKYLITADFNSLTYTITQL
ncbi:SusE domain-containing protein [Flavobacterium sp.]|uniref:SusE domain-containing protein n=1 Tax=Flavobacterium sp. TaxID=239 RepID=UPI003529CB03